MSVPVLSQHVIHTNIKARHHYFYFNCAHVYWVLYQLIGTFSNKSTQFKPVTMLHQFHHQFTPSDTADTHHFIRILTMLSDKPIIVASDFQIY